MSVHTYMCSVSQKKQYTWLLITTLANVHRFTKFCHYHITEKSLHTHTHHKDSPSHQKYVSTLPCETWKLDLLLISMAYCMRDFRIHLVRYETALIARSKSCDYKIWKTMQHCSEDQWCQRTEANDWHVTWAAADSHWWRVKVQPLF